MTGYSHEMTNGLISISTAFGMTAVHQIGEGHPIVVLHGGPGFSHSYLRPHLDFLSSQRQLNYFDQLGAGDTVLSPEEVTFSRIRNHSLAVIRNFAVDGRVTIVAHSWGGLIALACLDADRNLEVDGLLINPLPSTRTGFEAMRGALFSKLPDDLLSEILSDDIRYLTEAQIERLLKYYVSPQSTVRPASISFDMARYQSVCGTLDNYDYTGVLERLRSCHALLGADDFIDPLMINSVAAAAASVVSLNDCGHFPFLERPVEFRTWALQSLGAPRIS
jgi:proline iminopeptidase